ncbi:MAG: DUF2064 domain-containing protein, partial [Candidatus Omnitrophica bacterium]|nr:DUF2064 domain-containing protein [Candidatus Omnitrophota bacterium]
MAGRVKTRLAREVGATSAALIYRRCVEYMLPRLKAAAPKGVPIRVVFDPADWEPLFREWLGADYEFMPQPSGNLGRRLRQVCRAVHSQGVRRLLILGSDNPTVDPDWIG